MEYVIFDLEWNQPFANDISFMKRTGLPVSGEIIQIGAVKLDANLELIDTFSMLIKPQYLTRMHKHVEKLTHISAADLALGVSFAQAYRSFETWCGSNAVLLTWGSDDIVMLRENLRLFGLPSRIKHTWYDAQLIFAHLQHGNTQQVALSKALEELAITKDDLPAHDALNDSIFTGRVCKAIPLAEGIAQYDEIIKHTYSPAYFPEALSFFIYENFADKRTVLHDSRVRHAHCPQCQTLLALEKIQRLSGDKFISLGRCRNHGLLAVHWRIGKYMKRGNVLRYYVTKMLTEAPEKLQTLYAERTEQNRIKEEAYLARLSAQKKKESK
ncbi:3'-5' exonuclease [Veillonella intestinalis]|uniref:3'-5' exonuclease n=1 Tax=Veillonella intestinalis TaxID=2941341 RepID=UPI00203C4D49|nr:3'-5' exonuclease [Veillonella intestinalis]